MKLINAIIYIIKNKKKPIGTVMAIQDGSVIVSHGYGVFQNYLHYKYAMGIIYNYKNVYKVLKLLKVI